MMKDENVVFDRRYHVIYSKECKAQMLIRRIMIIGLSVLNVV